jgi:hypothetical protein
MLVAWGSASAQEVKGRQLRNAQAREARIALSLSLVSSIGSLNGTHDAFGNIWDVDIDSRGRIYVADYGQSRVTVFDRSGRFVRQLGRRGSGPGEFRHPMQLAVGYGDTLYVYDVGLRRLSKFAPSGHFIEQYALGQLPAANDIEFLPNGDVIIAGFAAQSDATLHLFDKEFRPRQSFASPDAAATRYFSESLLGGYTDLTPSGLLLYSQKSPFELRLYETSGRLRWRCRGLEGETTPPASVVRVEGDRRQLDWRRFIHTTAVFAISDSVYLNVITDPGNDRRRLDVIDQSCALRATSILNVPVSFVASRVIGEDRLLVGVRSLNYPEVVIYRLSVK